MDAVILAGGLGTRLRDIFTDIPKPLAPINGVPFLDLLLKQLSAIPQIKTVVLAVGYKAAHIQERYSGEKFPFKLLFSCEEQPLGTAGAIKKAIEKTTAEDLLILNGDSYLGFCFDTLMQTYKENHADIVIASAYSEDANRYGLLSIDDEGRIHTFTEKTARQTAGCINGGIYLMKRSLWQELPCVGSLEKDVFPIWVTKKMFAYICPGIFIDIGTPASWQEAQTLLKEAL